MPESSSSLMSAARRWDEAHVPSTTNDNTNCIALPAAIKTATTTTTTTTPSHLYTDENPATTIKGTGFKNKRIAQRTIELTSQHGVRYKQYWTVRAMRERAAHHQHPTGGIRDAIVVFDEWLSNYEEPTEEEKKEQREEWEAFRKLCQSDANQNSYGKNPSKEELDRARSDISDGQRLLFELLRTCRPNRETTSTPTTFPLTSFVALFGGPGLHGYGKHTINTDQCTSQVDIVDMHGIDELIGSTKTRKLTLISSCEFRIQYHRKKESASITIQCNDNTNPTLDYLWRKSTKRKRQEDDVSLQNNNRSDPTWTCLTCTFVHIGRFKLDYLACEVCGSERNGVKKK